MIIFQLYVLDIQSFFSHEEDLFSVITDIFKGITVYYF